MPLRICMLIVCCAFVSLGFDRAPSNSSVATWTIDGVTREAVVFAPTLDAGEKAPLVLCFHGHGGNMQGFSRGLPIHKLWPRAVVVYLQGLDTVSRLDPDGKKPGWQVEVGTDDDRDLKFVDAVLATMHKNYNIDDTRIYATGFSNGAFFTYLLWEQRPKIFAAYASIAGRIMSGKLSDARPVLVIAGEHDQRVKFDETKQLIANLRELNSATKDGEPCGTGCTLYRSKSATPVMTFFHNGGHLIPPEAGELVTNFFKDHAKK